MQSRVHWVVRVIRELDRVLEGALRSRRVENAPPPRLSEDEERELRVCRDTLRAAVDALEELGKQVEAQSLRTRELVEFLRSSGTHEVQSLRASISVDAPQPGGAAHDR